MQRLFPRMWLLAFLWLPFATSQVAIAEPLPNTCDGGTIQSAMGSDTLFYCRAGAGGGTGMFAFDSTTTASDNYAYVVTDDQGIILGLPPADMVNFTGAPAGECWVWGLSYTGNLTAQVGDDATSTMLSDACFDLTSNFIVVFRDSVDGGDVSTVDGADTTYVCIDGTDQFVSFASQNAVGPNFAYVVTDDQGTILGLPPGNTVNFAPAGVGECWVWGLSYSGDITAAMGDNALTTDLTDGCFDLSDNFLVVFRQELGLEIDYKNSENGGSAVTNRTIKPQLRVKNVGEKTLDLSRITMRYWFTEDVAGTYYSMCQGSDAGCTYTTVNLTSFTPAVPGADAYLEVGFTSGTIMPGERVNTRSLIRRNDGQNFDESDDHSFIGRALDHVMNPNVTLYYDGNLIAGVEPAGYSGQRLANQNAEVGNVMEVAVYPNPFMQKVELELDEAPAEGYQVRLTNLQGQVVFSGIRYGQKETLQVDQLPAGMYILQVEAGEARFTERVIKQ
ncbi:MAG: T9SS type A sorting domain-containing protein [Bacteroidota bacterium]